MIPDKDKPWTWVPYREGLCRQCTGACCTKPVEVKAQDLVRLGLVDSDQIERSPRKTAKQLIKAGIISSYREVSGNFMLSQMANGDCYFLDSKSRLCRVYDKRPGVCREFPMVGPKPGSCPANHAKKII